MINISQKLKVTGETSVNKSQKLGIVFLLLSLIFLTNFSTVLAQTVTPKPTAKPTAKPTGSTSRTASPSGTLKVSGTPSPEPTSVEDAKVKEIRDAIKEKVNEIKDKIEKRAYVGVVQEITDSTLTLTNFRGKQRVRLMETTTIIGGDKKEIKAKDVAVDDKIIALGVISDNDILEARRVIVVPKPKTTPVKRISLFGTISQVDSKGSTINVTELKNLDNSVTVKVDKTSLLSSQIDTKAKVAFKDLKENQKVMIFYPETSNDKTPVVKSLFILP